MVVPPHLAFTNGNNVNQDGFPLFEKHEIIGKGAYGAVYRGTNTQTGKVIALKVGGDALDV